MKITIIGAGYVGLTTASCLAQLGHSVIGVDVDATKVDHLNSGVIPIVEDGLESITRQMLDAKRLVFQLGYSDSIKSAEFIFLCVPTPQDEDGSADGDASAEPDIENAAAPPGGDSQCALGGGLVVGDRGNRDSIVAIVFK